MISRFTELGLTLFEIDGIKKEYSICMASTEFESRESLLHMQSWQQSSLVAREIGCLIHQLLERSQYKKSLASQYNSLQAIVQDIGSAENV
jgi:hypothetical protein